MYKTFGMAAEIDYLKGTTLWDTVENVLYNEEEASDQAVRKEIRDFVELAKKADNGDPAPELDSDLVAEGKEATSGKVWTADEAAQALAIINPPEFDFNQDEEEEVVEVDTSFLDIVVATGSIEQDYWVI